MTTKTALLETPDLRSSVRFPLRLPIAVHCDDVEYVSETSDISSGGVLFRSDVDLQVGSYLDFSIAMPAKAMGTSKDVVVNCRGRVIRCSDVDGQSEVAAVIDDYCFVR